MGFPVAKAKKVIEESKSTALNDLIDLILKDLTSEVEAQTLKQPQKIEYGPYSCDVCTFLNKDSPSSIC
jgi:hypothetical protein